MIEVWKIIEDYPDYQISNFGRIRSLKFEKERILKFGNNNRGYLHVLLYNNGESKRFRIHRLVLKIFKPITNSEDFQCNHIDGNKKNNNINNLEWCTCSENNQHAFKIGLKNHKGENHPIYGKHHTEETKKKMSKSHVNFKGESHPNHKLINKEIREIKQLIKDGILYQREIAKIYKVSRNTISMIKLGQRWKYIT